MKPQVNLLIALLFCYLPFVSLALVGEKPRVLILTDIENEPDDAQSLVRFMVYSNQFDVEGIVATTSCWQRKKIADWRIHEIIDAYEKVRPNLLKHEEGYPEAEFLRNLVKKGYPAFGMDAVGAGKSSEGSDWLVTKLSEPNEHPLWVLIWGGANTLAQALWQMQMSLPPQEFDRMTRKLRVYTIGDQDDSGPWIRNNFPNVFYIVSPGYHENGGNANFHATWTGISGERFYKFPSGADTDIIRNPWLHENIQKGHGALGEEYPDIAYVMEGDSPSFLYLINNGLGSPENPDWGSWGGRYELYTPPYKKFFHEPETRPIWTNVKDMVWVGQTCYVNEQATIWRWREAYQNDFAARMDWCIKDYAEANHPPVAALSHENIITVRPGQLISLNGSPSIDPDGDNLSFTWLHYRELGNFVGDIKFENKNSPETSFTAPKVDKARDFHIIMQVTDDGEPALTRYQRVIINVIPE